MKKAGGDPAKMPDTWADVLALATKIKAGGSDVAGIGYNVHDWPDDWLCRAMILQGGGRMLDASETQVAFGGPVGLKALETSARWSPTAACR